MGISQGNYEKYFSFVSAVVVFEPVTLIKSSPNTEMIAVRVALRNRPVF